MNVVLNFLLTAQDQLTKDKLAIVKRVVFSFTPSQLTLIIYSKLILHVFL